MMVFEPDFDGLVEGRCFCKQFFSFAFGDFSGAV
jgi:hypothetical protein